MPRNSGFRGTFSPNKRPYLTLTADAYVSLQGETTVIGCGECRREININKYVTGISTEASIDSSPGSATITLSIPDNDINEFYVDGQFLVIPMMEIELYAKGYYTIGGFPQYYRIFWGIVSNTNKQWSNGITTITLGCKDILRWWELTQTTLNPAFSSPEGHTKGNFVLFGNQFAGANPYTVIIDLAREAMGNFSLTTGSLNGFQPESGPENRVFGAYAKDIMAYWQLKFGNIWNSLVLYGTSGQAYTFSGEPGTVSPVQITKQLFDAEAAITNPNPAAGLLKVNPQEIAVFKQSLDNTVNIHFFQTEARSKLEIAMTARDQAGFEFYCDTTGDIVFKPPFYNLNVIPNKPVSWVQDFEVIEDNLQDTEQEVYTHVTASGNAFGGVFDPGLNDEITTPATGVIDFHLLRRYGWRRTELQVEWAGDPRKLFYHLLDWIDRVNSKRQSGSVVIPMRPEIRMGFPIWFPRYDSFFYVQGISHQFSPGGQATTTLTLTAKRSKFIAPKNIGRITPTAGVSKSEASYAIEFPSDVGATSGNSDGRAQEDGGPAILRDPNSGRLLGFPNVVMVYRKSTSNEVLARVLGEHGSKYSNKPNQKDQKRDVGPTYTEQQVISDVNVSLQNAHRAETIARLRHHRYEAGMSNAGLYDYAHDTSKSFKEFTVIRTDRITWGTGTSDPNNVAKSFGLSDSSPSAGAIVFKTPKEKADAVNQVVQSFTGPLNEAKSAFNAANKIYRAAQGAYTTYLKKKYQGKKAPQGNELDSEDRQQLLIRDNAKADVDVATANVARINSQILDAKTGQGPIKPLTALSMIVRPVSDEFGFEVIGHYRYGRGAFIDRGQVTLKDPTNSDKTVNQINIQFAASGGLLTNNPKLDNLGPQSSSFAQSFEQMQPDDYLTGASFTGSSYGPKDVDPNTVNYTNQKTYSDSINHSIADTGKAVFAEADATRRAISLAELSPVMSNGLDEANFNKCDCSLGRANWLSVLPRLTIQTLLGSVGATQVVPNPGGRQGTLDDQELPTEQSILVAAGSTFSLTSPGGFFDVLHDYLMSRFDADYRLNSEREQFASNGGREVETPNTPDDNNILPAPSDTLFNRAAQGDPNALDALQKTANFNFGLSKKALDEFKTSTAASGAALKQAVSDLPGSIFDNVTGALKNPPFTKSSPVMPQVQPKADPTIGDLLNPRGNSYSSPYIDYKDVHVNQGKDPGRTG